MKDELFKKTENMLYNYTNIEAQIEIIDFKLKDISVGAIAYEERTTPTNEIHSSVETKTLKALELEEKKKQLLFKKELIDKTLKLLDKTERELVELRYFGVRKLNWSHIAAKMNLSDITCMRMRNKIINEIKPFFS